MCCSERRPDSSIADRSTISHVPFIYAMPGMNGFELAQRIKARNPKLPIVLATGYAELPADRSIEFGQLSKPYTSKELAAALEKLFH
jgi:CheY-like chemotaxis protein